MDRNKFIDDLITAGAKDDEIADALKLADEKNEFGQQQEEQPIDNGEGLINAAKGIGNALVVEPFKTVTQKVPAAAGSFMKEPAQTSLGGLKGAYNWITGGINPIISGAKSIATNPLIQKIPNIPTFEAKNEAQQKGMEATQGLADIASVALPVAGPAMKAAKGLGLGVSAEEGLSNAVAKGVSKGIIPPVSKLKTLSMQEGYRKNTGDALMAVKENKDALNVVNSAGKTIDIPKTADEALQAFTQTKKTIWDKASGMSKAAGQAGAEFNTDPIISELNKVAQPPGEVLTKGDSRLGYSEPIRKYANDLKQQVEELQGAPPEVIEQRIKEYNTALNGYYAGTTDAVKAQVQGSVAKVMRKALDDQITETLGQSGYQDLKKQYGAIRSIEEDVAKRAALNARSAQKGSHDLADLFATGEVLTGIATGNAIPVVRGLSVEGAKALIKARTSPDRYIADMFKKAYNMPQEATKAPATAWGPEVKARMALQESHPLNKASYIQDLKFNPQYAKTMNTPGQMGFSAQQGAGWKNTLTKGQEKIGNYVGEPATLPKTKSVKNYIPLKQQSRLGL